MEDANEISEQPAPLSREIRGQRALEKLRPAMQRLPPARVRPVDLDVGVAVLRVLTVLPAVRELRPLILSECPAVDLAAIDELEDRALATACVQAHCERAPKLPQHYTAVL